MDKAKKGYLYVAIFTFLAAVSYLLADFTFRYFENISVANVLFWGWLGAVMGSAPFFLGWRSRRRRLIFSVRKHWRVLILVSALTSLGGGLWFWAMAEVGSGSLALLTNAKIFWIFLLGVIFLKERVAWREIPGLLLAAGGLFLVSTLQGEVSGLAAMLILGQTILYALQSFFIKKYAPEVDGAVFAFGRAVMMFFFLGTFFLLRGQVSLIPWTAVLLVSVSQIIGLVVARAFYFQAINLLPISKLSALLLLEPILVLGGAYLFFGDAVSSQKGVGAVLILGGLLWFTHEQLKIAKKRRFFSRERVQLEDESPV